MTRRPVRPLGLVDILALALRAARSSSKPPSRTRPTDVSGAALARTVGIVLVAMLSAACGPEPASSGPSTDPPTATVPNLAGSTWRLVAIDGAVPAPGPDVTLRFEGDRVSGQGPCNGFGAALAIDAQPGRIAFGDLVSTKRACVDQARGALENSWFEALRLVTTAAFEDPARLVLSGGGHDVVLERVR
jgi:heat shock protein HslJ